MKNLSHFVIMIFCLCFFSSITMTAFAGEINSSSSFSFKPVLFSGMQPGAGGSFLIASQSGNTDVSDTESSDYPGNELDDEDLDAELDDDLDEEFVDEFEDTSEQLTIADPLYYFNYAMYSVNDALYFYALKPLATGYKAVTPDIMRQGVKNFFHNLLFPVRFVNNLLQGEIKDATNEVGIFVINTTMGILGFSQVAQNELGMKTCDEDLGQTLGSYSIGNGFYLVLPILGPSSLRDVVGLAGDYFLTPVNYVEPWEASAGIKAYDAVNSTSFRLGDYEELKAAALDPYVAIKDAYIKNRAKKIKE